VLVQHTSTVKIHEANSYTLEEHKAERGSSRPSYEMKQPVNDSLKNLHQWRYRTVLSRVLIDLIKGVLLMPEISKPDTDKFVLAVYPNYG
jgi:hypothetical protein